MHGYMFGNTNTINMKIISLIYSHLENSLVITLDTYMFLSLSLC